MFGKVLVANRGAIACRIFRTLDRMGIASVGVYAAADAFSRHVEMAGESALLGDGRAAETYLDFERILGAARATRAEAIHPGYGFLSENAEFARRCEAEGFAWVGPTPDQMLAFGRKHSARRLAEASAVPVVAGSALLADVEQACMEARRIGFPVMLKSDAGGGGIGMALCRNEDALRGEFARVARLAGAHFGDASVFLERYVEHARHIEIQIFGDGRGAVAALGERDCSCQRRNQKVVEEAPAPDLPESVRHAMCEAALRLGRAVAYRSAGTVEFLYDVPRAAFHFLEVNTRLQVEHGVSEAVLGIDLVEWMLRVAAGDPPDLEHLPEPRGHAIQARLYAESPIRGFEPSAGLLTEVSLPEDLRCDHWLAPGLEISPLFDPLLAKLIAWGETREQARARLADALQRTRISGIDTNRDFLRALLDDARFRRGGVETSFLAGLDLRSPVVEVLESGLQSSVQDWPGRRGYWNVGVPPSGPMDALAHRAANRLVGNAEDAAALEIAVRGPTLRFHVATCIALCGAAFEAELDGVPLPAWRAVEVPAGSVLRIGGLLGAGQRAALAVAGGFDVPLYLGSRATFALGHFGGHGGRTLRRGDVLRLFESSGERPHETEIAVDARPVYPKGGEAWQLDVCYGPHGAPEFLTPEDVRAFFAADWEVHYHSSRTGIRLIGPRPQWARSDGGEAGLHPSNVHDTPYAIGAIDFTGDMPVLLGLDGPSLGGFVCPATVTSADLWKIGQLAPGDRVHFRPVSRAAALRRESELEEQLARGLAREPQRLTSDCVDPLQVTPSRVARPATSQSPALVIREAGDRFLLLELGPMQLDPALRLLVHALVLALEEKPLAGVIDLTPGIRSLQVHFDSRKQDADQVVAWLLECYDALPGWQEIEVPTRVVHLPLCWDDASTREAIRRYQNSVRSDAPWCPDNIEFIRRINGLPSRDAVREIVYAASYLVLGLGDVYLGAPVATPLDPRHRLVTAKYNPARTWTPENAVGIGGAYLCVYGMEGPGGYQFVGRTLQMWNSYRETECFERGRPWLLRCFDQIRFFPVEEPELQSMRRDFLRGCLPLRIERASFGAAAYARFLESNAPEIAAFQQARQAAFEAERERWAAAGLAVHVGEAAPPAREGTALPEGAQAQESPVAGSCLSIAVAEGDAVCAGDLLCVVESMKMEVPVASACSGRVVAVMCRVGDIVAPGQALIAVFPTAFDGATSAD